MATHVQAGVLKAKKVTSKSFVGPLTGSPILPTYTVAQLNALVGAVAGTLVRCSDGNAGAACVAMFDGTNWKVIALGATVATS